MNRHIVAYDVSDDRARERVAGVLLALGVRIQRSVFEIESTDVDAVVERLAAIIDEDADVVQVFPRCRGCERGERSAGQAGPGIRAPWWVA